MAVLGGPGSRRVIEVKTIFALLLAAGAAFAQTPRSAMEAAQEGLQLKAKGDPQSLRLAVDRFTEAIALFHSENQPAFEVQMFSARANVYDLLKEFDQSARDFHSAEEMFRKLGDHKNEALAVDQEGLELKAKGDPQSLRLAVDRFTEAIALFHSENQPALEVQMISARANVYDLLKEFDQSARDFRSAAGHVPKARRPPERGLGGGSGRP